MTDDMIILDATLHAIYTGLDLFICVLL